MVCTSSYVLGCRAKVYTCKTLTFTQIRTNDLVHATSHKQEKPVTARTSASNTQEKQASK